jgi:hypothetical protein
MPWRFYRRLRLARGLTLNLSKRGASVSAGRRGARVTFGRRGTRTTTSLPGTGISYTKRAGCLLPVLLILAAALVSCTGSGSQSGAAIVTDQPRPSAPPSQSGTASSATLAASPVTVAPSRAPSPTAPPVTRSPSLPTQVSFTSVRSPVSRGGTGLVNVTTAPNMACTITVTYKSGPSQAVGLGPKNSDSSGAVSWTWNIGTNTTAGTWPIEVQCGTASGRTSFVVQ